MLPICQVCLRTDRKLQCIEDSLDDFYDELCDYAACQVQSVSRFCSECAYMLRKCNEFKEKCRLAIKILKSWKMQKAAVRQPITVLAAQIPSSPLTYGKKENYKVYKYYYQDLKADPETPVNVTNYIYPYIAGNTVVDGIPTTKLQPFDYNIIQNECLIETDIKMETDLDHMEDTVVEDHIEYDAAQNVIKTSDLDVDSDTNFSVNEADIGVNKVNIGDNESNISGNNLNISVSKDNVSEFDQKLLILQTTIKTESDLSDNEALATKRTKTQASTHKRGRVRRDIPKKRHIAMPFDLTALKEKLVAKFADAEELKDEDGTVLDKDLILNSLDKMPQRKLQHLTNITGTKTFTPEALKFFAQLQKKYSDEYSTIFTTEYLPSRELVEVEFRKRQGDASYAAAEHKCGLCYRGFKHRKMLDFHIRVQHDESRPHACRVCRMRFNSASSLRWHISSHSTVFKCKLCPLVTNYRKTMLDHYHYHNGDVYNCTLCQATFKSRSGLCLHSIRAHPTRHACGECARAFASARGLAAHRRLKHREKKTADIAESATCDATEPRQRRKTVKPNFVCPVCQTTEHSYGAMSWHFRAEHPTLSFRDMYTHKHLCHVCGKGYSSPRALAEHKHVHTGAKPYACAECPAAFGTRVSLRLHSERHRPRARECPHCGKKFVSASNLSNHMKQHTGLRRHKCQLCDKSFMHSNSLNEHIRGVHYHIRRSRKKATSYTETEQEHETS